MTTLLYEIITWVAMKRSFDAASAGADGPTQAAKQVGWTCSECSSNNLPMRDRCFKCKAPRAIAYTSGLDHPSKGHTPAVWQEAFDPHRRQIYYYNSITAETTWDRPPELAPSLASGHYGRSSSTAHNEIVSKNREWLKHPARKQAEFDATKVGGYTEGENDYNIWYGKFHGDQWRGKPGQLARTDPAPSRCIPETDAGHTKASGRGITSIHSNERAYFCIHFARGACHLGPECGYYHHIPSGEDEAVMEAGRDCFGRERHKEHRDDMAGVGTFASDCRTLYVGGIKMRKAGSVSSSSSAGAGAGSASSAASRDATEDVVRANFAAFGEIESINVISRKAIAFVRYRYRVNAEFALVAMSNQSLLEPRQLSGAGSGTGTSTTTSGTINNGEVLMVRWAYDDPNPVAQQAALRSDIDAFAAAVVAKGHSVTPAGFQYPADYQIAFSADGRDEVTGGSGSGGAAADMPMGRSTASGSYTSAVTSLYPLTNHQYHMPLADASSSESSAAAPTDADSAASGLPGSNSAASDSGVAVGEGFTGSDALAFLTGQADGGATNGNDAQSSCEASGGAVRSHTTTTAESNSKSHEAKASHAQPSAALSASALPTPPLDTQSAAYAQWYYTHYLPWYSQAAASATRTAAQAAM